MLAGIEFIAGGSWEPPSGGFPVGRLVSSNGLVTGARSAAGIVALTLNQPTDAGNVACIATARGTGTSFDGPSIDQTSDSVKTVRFRNPGGESGGQDVAFDFVFVRFGH